MITDFSEYTGQRSITINGKNSLTDFGILMHKETQYPTITPQISQEKIPYRNGSIDFSTFSGSYTFENRKFSIAFLVLAETNAEVLEKISALNNWLFEVTDKKLYDSDIVGYCFTNVVCTETYTEALIKGGVPAIGFRAEFTAAPYLESINGTRSAIITLAGKNITAYILHNSVLCLGYTGVGDMTEEISDATITLTFILDGSFAGLKCFEVAGNVDFELTSGSLDGVAVTLAGAHNGYLTVPASGGTLTLIGSVTGSTSDNPYVILGLAPGIAFAHDNAKKYKIDDYAVGTHSLTVNGTAAAFSGFTISGDYDVLEITGQRNTNVYKFWYDSVEVSL